MPLSTFRGHTTEISEVTDLANGTQWRDGRGGGCPDEICRIYKAE